MFHYTSCGLKNVYLSNGYRVRETPYGDAVAIENIEGLHKAIGQCLVEGKSFLTGPEFRFLRKELGMSQKRIASIIGNDSQTVALWEKHARVPKWGDHWVRVLYRLCKLKEDHDVIAMIDRVNDIDRLEHNECWQFEKNREEHWQARVACA